MSKKELAKKQIKRLEARISELQAAKETQATLICQGCGKAIAYEDCTIDGYTNCCDEAAEDLTQAIISNRSLLTQWEDILAS